jgi:hypothetical protein
MQSAHSIAAIKHVLLHRCADSGIHLSRLVQQSVLKHGCVMSLYHAQYVLRWYVMYVLLCTLCLQAGKHHISGDVELRNALQCHNC